MNGPSAWISSSVDDPLGGVKPPDPVKTRGEPSRADPTSEATWHEAEQGNMAGKQVSEVEVQQFEDEVHGSDSYERKKVLLTVLVN